MSRGTRFTVRQGEMATAVEIRPDGRIEVAGAAAPFTVEAAGVHHYVVGDGNRRWHVWVAGPDDARVVCVEGASAVLEVAADGARQVTKKRRSHGDASAPMPATVIAVLVAPGQTVAAGDVVLKLEAMKMELPVRAPRAGTVRAIHCQVGELVQAGVVLVDIT
jgi:3-methylcrotonyl-CoA carboxylase alpha subunit